VNVSQGHFVGILTNVFRLRIKIQFTSGYTWPKITPERLGSKPRTKANKETRKDKHYDKGKED
jgi:hypothetical protein